MSEIKNFNVGDKVVFKYGSMPKDLMTIEFVSLDGSCVDVFEDFNPILSEVLDIATPEEIAAGHRIDNDLGDDFPIENHISPNCKVSD
ncbi:hypothetical protein [Acinetobacter oleivorans]|uniref:hypothetical protein n=1 Tax=Acinetobacter oleivorans TaxID=1148157 RepID=UPI0012314582|nr:hypothetical protein [Acinetobacter oleivorans]